MGPVQPFDLQRMFLGDLGPLFLLEIVVRTIILYVYTLIMLRLMGKRSMGHLSTFDFVIIIALGSAVGDPMFYAAVPLIYGMVVITVVVVLERALAYGTMFNKPVEDFVEGKPILMVDQGRLDLEGMTYEKLSRDELFARLRLHGAQQLGEVKVAYLENTGEVSVFMFDPPKTRPGLPLVPPWEIVDFPAYSAQGAVPQAGYYACCRCGHTIEYEEDVRFTLCPYCHNPDWTSAVRDSLEILSEQGIAEDQHR